MIGIDCLPVVTWIKGHKANLLLSWSSCMSPHSNICNYDAIVVVVLLDWHSESATHASFNL